MTSLRTITPPAAEPVSLETVKEHLRIDLDAEDALLETYLAAAREDGEELSRRAFITQTLEMIVDTWPQDGILTVLRPPLQSVTSVKYYDSDNVQHTWTDYIVDADSEPGRIIFNTLPGDALRESGAIVVRFVAGYGDASEDVPNRIRRAILMLVGHYYENREAVNVGNIVTVMPLSSKNAFLAERVVWF